MALPTGHGDVAFPDFSVLETITGGDERSAYLLVRACRIKEGGAPFLVKCPASSLSPSIAHRQLERELQVAGSLEGDAILRPLKIEYLAGRPVLLLEDFDCCSLERYCDTPMRPERFLETAIGICKALENIHARSILHKDIKPAHILLHKKTKETKITGFGTSSSLPREFPAAQAPRLVEGTPAYMSPEQTGRMNRPVDCRSDLYSMGICFYQLLTGRLPFEASDPLEWFHCHIARKPRPAVELVPELPRVISDIVLMLLAKAAEERYQSVSSVRADLEECLAICRSSHEITSFSLDRHEISPDLRIPQKLYGRQKETDELLRLYDSVANTGRPEFVLVSGYSGIGKSSLVHELHPRIVRDRGLFISGKFDQLKREIPYSTLAHASRQLIQYILADSEDRLARWRHEIQNAVGNNGQLLIEVVPEANLLIGPQPSLPELPPEEAQARFNAVFQRFLGVFAKEDHPLTLFLDDLQWVDSASLALIHQIAAHPETRYLLLIGAYRDNEVSSSHPLVIALDRLRQAGVPIREFHLAPLSLKEVEDFTADTLSGMNGGVSDLASICHEKTSGNPFFVIQFLQRLNHDRLIFFDSRESRWQWDTGRIRAQGYTANVIDFLVERLRCVPAQTRQALQFAACIGNKGNIETLSAICGEPPHETLQVLRPAIQEALLIITGNEFRFAHDRVQQAAYSLIPEDRLSAVHLQIGRLLLKTTPSAEIKDHVFEIVTQLNRGASLIHHSAERKLLMEMNLLAGQKAKKSIAYKAAMTYLASGVGLLLPDDWKDCHALSFALNFALAECEYLEGNFDRAECAFAALLTHAESNIERASIRRAEIDLLASTNRLDRAVDRGIAALHLFGIDMPANPTREQVLKEIADVFRILGDREIEDLISLPAINSTDMQAALDILAVLFGPALSMNPDLPFLCYCHMVKISLIHGHSDASALAYAYFGMMLGELLGRYQEGYRFGKLGYRLVEERGFTRHKAKVCFIFGDTVNFWTRHLRTDLPYLLTAFQTAVESGDITFAGYCCNHIGTLFLILGTPLDEVARQLDVRLDFTRNANFDASFQVLTGTKRLVQNMRGLTSHFSTFSDENFDQDEYETLMDGYGWTIVTCWYYILKVQARFMSCDFQEAVAAGHKARPLLWSSFSHIQEPEYWYYYALSLAALLKDAGPERRQEGLETLRVHQQKFKVWSDNCPENFLNKYLLVSAEIGRISGKPAEEVLRLYDEAIRSAREHGFIQNEGIGNELAGKYCFSMGLECSGQYFIEQAANCYLRWGAGGKVSQLGRQFPFLHSRRSALSGILAAPPERLDLMTVVKASHTISGQIVLPDLYNHLTGIMLESTGAETGLLIITSANQPLTVVSEGKFTPALEVRPVNAVPVSNFSTIPRTIANYVARTRESVVLDDASNESRFLSDEYILNRKPRSVLCLPLLWRERLVGLFYMENNQIRGAFTEERLTVLQLLASQAAISLENARLYSDLKKAEERLRAIVDNAPAVIYMKDPSGKLLLVNRQFEELVHLPHEKIQGKTDLEFFPREVAEKFMANDVQVLAQKSAMQWEEVAPHNDGLHTYISTKFPLLNSTGEPYALCGISTDITDRKRAEEERSRLLDELKEALHARDEFISIASHELKTPLTPLIMYLEVLKKMLQTPAMAGVPEAKGVPKMIETADRQVRRLSDLVNELLDVSRITHGRLSLEFDTFDLVAMVQNALERFKPELEKAGCSLQLSAPGPVIGCWDDLRIEQVFSNLLMNAVKYGGGKPIEVSVWAEDGAAKLAVRDQGIGIAKEDRQKIFDRFERAVSFRNYPGLGLGLYIARQIVTAHHGFVEVESELGRGSLFIVSLPLQQPGGVARGEQPAPEVAAPCASSPGTGAEKRAGAA